MNKAKGHLSYSMKSREQRTKCSLLFLILSRKTDSAILVTFYCLISSIHLALGQNSFEVIHASPGYEYLYYSFEDVNKNYVAIGGCAEAFGVNKDTPCLLKLNKKGEIIGEKLFPKEDSTSYFKYGFQKQNGNYFLMGALSDTSPSYRHNYTYLMEITPDLEVVWEKVHPIPSEFNNHFIINYLITPDSILILQGRMDSSMYGSNDLLFLSKLDMDGNLLAFIQPTGWKDYGVYGDLIFKPDSNGFYLVGDIVYNSIPREWVEFDNNLNILAWGLIEDSLSYLCAPLSINRLENGNMIIANLSIGITVPSLKDLEMRIIDPAFNLIKDTLIFHDEYVYIPVNKGLVFNDDDNIWVATFEQTFHYVMGTEVFRFHIFDSELHLKGVKAYGDDTRYWLFDMIVTSDGGCLVTGIVPDFEGSYDADGYIIKVMPSDILTSAELPPMEDEGLVVVTPNPFSDFIRIENKTENICLSMFNVNGVMVYEERIPGNTKQVVSTKYFPQGLYLYLIIMDDKMIQSGKLFKQ